MTVHEYFHDHLGRAPDKGLSELDVDSPCGQDCKRVIDAAKELLSLCDSAPSVRDPIIQGVDQACQIFWYG